MNCSGDISLRLCPSCFCMVNDIGEECGKCGSRFDAPRLTNAEKEKLTRHKDLLTRYREMRRATQEQAISEGKCPTCLGKSYWELSNYDAEMAVPCEDCKATGSYQEFLKRKP